MAMTKTTTIVWGSEEEQYFDSLNTARTAKLTEMATDGKTDLAVENINPVTTKRFWRDIAAAEEFISFIMEQAEIYQCTIVSTLTEDYTAPV